MKATNLKLSELIEEMRNIIHNNGIYCFSDTIIDLQTIAEFDRENDMMYWGIRQNGTRTSKSFSEMKEWQEYFKGKSEICQGIYEIKVLKGKYSIEKIEEIKIKSL